MKKQKDKKTKKSSQILSAAVVSLLMLAGLALLLYPTVADKINDSVNHEIISDYQKKVNRLDDEKYNEILDAAGLYNEELALKTPYITELTAEKRAEYKTRLDIDGTGIMGYIEIPKAKIYLAIYHGTAETVLQTGVGHLEASSLPVPGKSVHTVLAGHSGLPSARLFTDLDQLEIGDTFSLHVLNETLTYRVEKMQRMAPDELKNLRIEEGQELCTLMTCTPYGINTHRLVVTGRRIETPAAQKSDETSIVRAVTSKWNRWFVFLPAVLFAGIVAAVILIRIHIKRGKKPD